MDRYAQTNLQLLNDMSSRDYKDVEISQAIRAYKLAAQMFVGKYRSSGKSLLAHVVGTAGILVNANASINSVCVALLHAAFQKDADKRVKEQIENQVSCEVADLIREYQNLPWQSEDIKSYAKGFSDLTTENRISITVRLANEVEDHYDLGIYYMNESRRDKLIKRYSESSQNMMTLAKKLGLPVLSQSVSNIETDSIKRSLPEKMKSLVNKVD